MNWNPSHYSVDIETFGTKPGSVIIGLGVVRFNPNVPGEIHGRYGVTIQPENAQARGLRIDASTVCWWLDPAQRPAWDAYLSSLHFELDVALSGMVDWMDLIDQADPGNADEVAVGHEDMLKHMRNRRCVWGNGAGFDNVLLRTAFEVVGIETPWAHWNDRCFRTMKSLPGSKDVVPPWTDLVKHVGVDDAHHQALWLQNIVQKNGLTI